MFKRSTGQAVNSLIQNYLDPFSGIQNGTFSEATRADVPVKLIAVDDIGAFAAIAFRSPEAFIGRTIEIAGDALTPPQIAAAISQAVGRSIPYVPIPLEAIRSQNEILAADGLMGKAMRSILQPCGNGIRDLWISPPGWMQVEPASPSSETPITRQATNGI